MSNSTRTFIGFSMPARRWIALGLAVLITLAGGVLYGSYVQRWNAPAELSGAATWLKEFPGEIGNWKAVEELPIGEHSLQMLECAGYISRRYVNQDSGQSIQLAIMLGPPGPIAVHTPEICYSSRAYEMESERALTPLEVSPNRRHSFWRLDFSTRNAFADGLRVYYAWGLGSEWKASDSPRFEFAGSPLLYKLQLASSVSPRLSEDAADPGQEFLEELLKSSWMRGHNFDGSAVD
jgi:Protein of unknown function (DUF3485)